MAEDKKIEPTEVVRYLIGGLVVDHQLHNTKNFFHHRIVLSGIADDTTWYSYTQLAVVKIPFHTFVGTTDYYAGVLPPMFEMTEAEKGKSLTPAGAYDAGKV